MAEVKNRFNYLYLLAVPGLSAAGILLIIRQTGGLPIEFLGKIQLRYLVLAGWLLLASWLVEAWRIKYLLKLVNAPLPLLKILQVNLAAGFIGAVSPAAAGNPPAQAYFLQRAGLPWAKSAAVVVMRMAATMFCFGIFASLTILMAGSSLSLARPIRVAALAAGIILVCGILLFICLLVKPACLSPGAARFLKLGRIHKKAAGMGRYIDIAAHRFQSFSSVLRSFWQAGGLKGLLAVLLITMLYWACFFSIAPVLLAGLEQDFKLVNLLSRQLVYVFAMAYVPLPGASGVAEIGLSGLIAPFIPAGWLAGFVLTWRFFTYYSYIIIGGPLFLFSGYWRANRQ